MTKQKQQSDGPRNMVIRRATAFDVVNLAKMLTKSNGERAERGWDPGVPEGYVGEFLAVRYLLALIDLGLVFVADLEGRLMGAIGNTIHQPPWSDEWAVLNEWFYVLPQFRESEIAEALVHATNSWADAVTDPRTSRKKAQIGVIFRAFPDMTGITRQSLEELEFVFDNGGFRRAPLAARTDDEVTPPADPPADPPQTDTAAAA